LGGWFWKTDASMERKSIMGWSVSRNKGESEATTMFFSAPTWFSKEFDKLAQVEISVEDFVTVKSWHD
jgi:hypothetical protein